MVKNQIEGITSPTSRRRDQAPLQLAMTDLTKAIPENGQRFTLNYIKQLPEPISLLVRGWKYSASGDLEVKRAVSGA